MPEHEERRKSGALDRRKHTPGQIEGIVQTLRDHALELNDIRSELDDDSTVVLMQGSLRNLADTIEGG